MKPTVLDGAKDIKPYQVKALMEAINHKGVFESARRKWANMSKQDRIEYIKDRYCLKYYNGEGDEVNI